MSNFYSVYIGGNNGSGGGVQSLNGLNGALSLVAGSNITITPAGSTITIASTASAGANTALSNLVTTSINQDLIPNADLTLNIGSAANRWNSGRFGTVDASSFRSLVPGDAVTVFTTNNLAGNSGNLTLSVGTASATRGVIQLVDGSESGGAGYVWTLQDTAGTGHWAAASSGAALSSLTAATTTNTINNANNAQVWNWNSLTTETGLKIASSSVLTSGSLLNLTTSNNSNQGSLLSMSAGGSLSTAITGVTHGGPIASFTSSTSGSSSPYMNLAVSGTGYGNILQIEASSTSISNTATGMYIENGSPAASAIGAHIQLDNGSAIGTGLLIDMGGGSGSGLAIKSNGDVQINGKATVSATPSAAQDVITLTFFNSHPGGSSTISPNLVLAGPASGGAATPTYRSLVAADIPSIDTLLPSQTGNSGKFLTTNGSVSSWATAGGGGGANTTLSNLVNTTAIPVDLNFASGYAGTIRTADDTVSQALTILSGNSTIAASGAINISTGNSAAGSSGNLELSTGTGAINSGNIDLIPGAAPTQGYIFMQSNVIIGALGSSLHSINTQFDNGTGSGVASFTNVPTSAPQPTGYIEIIINGNLSYIPYFQ